LSIFKREKPVEAFQNEDGQVPSSAPAGSLHT